MTASTTTPAPRLSCPERWERPCVPGPTGPLWLSGPPPSGQEGVRQRAVTLHTHSAHVPPQDPPTGHKGSCEDKATVTNQPGARSSGQGTAPWGCRIHAHRCHCLCSGGLGTTGNPPRTHGEATAQPQRPPCGTLGLTQCTRHAGPLRPPAAPAVRDPWVSPAAPAVWDPCVHPVHPPCGTPASTCAGPLGLTCCTRRAGPLHPPVRDPWVSPAAPGSWELGAAVPVKHQCLKQHTRSGPVAHTSHPNILGG